MGLKSFIAALTGPKPPHLTSEDAGAARVGVAKLAAHTAEAMIIVTIDPAAVAVVREIARSGEAATLEQDATSVHLRPTQREELPVKDPRKGWIIPLPPRLRQAITDTLTDAPGGYELSPQLAIIVEADTADSD